MSVLGTIWYSIALKIPTGFVVVENSAVYHNLGRCGRELHSRSLLGDVTVDYGHVDPYWEICGIVGHC